MVHRVTRRVESWRTFFASLFVLAVVLAIQLYQPAPYRDVEVRLVERRGDAIAFIANFEKTACVFDRLTVVGGVAGEAVLLAWRDLDGLPDNHDRSNGRHTLRIAFDAERDLFDWIEVRTQHDCNGEKVSKIFYRIEPVI